MNIEPPANVARLTDDRTISAAAAWRCGGFGPLRRGVHLCRQRLPGQWASLPGRSTPPAGSTATTTTPLGGGLGGWQLAFSGSLRAGGDSGPGLAHPSGSTGPCCCILVCFEDPWGVEIISRSGMVTQLNQTPPRYAPVRTLTVRNGRAGAPLPGAAVFFEILNACQWVARVGGPAGTPPGSPAIRN